MQLVLNEFLDKLALPFVSSSAFSQARRHLAASAFIELNQEAVIKVCYQGGDYATYKGFRLLAIDGSKIHLPDEADIRAEFGTTKAQIGFNQQIIAEQALGQASVLYDLLNRVALDSILAENDAYEVELAVDHLIHTQANDLILFDRNYPSYYWLAVLSHLNRHFVGRCSQASFKPVRNMFAGHGPDSQIVTLRCPSNQRQRIRNLGLSETITVRLVRLILDTGEIEILITSLLDEALFPTAQFKPLYQLRWGVETFYDVIKNRLLLENFTGRCVEAVKQDFYSTIFISGLESLLTQEANIYLQDKSVPHKHIQQVNRAVSFNAIKNHVIELFLSETDETLILDKLTRLFLLKPSYIREGRVVSRLVSSSLKRLHFQRRRRKVCF